MVFVVLTQHTYQTDSSGVERMMQAICTMLLNAPQSYLFVNYLYIMSMKQLIKLKMGFRAVQQRFGE